ncbi:hypothetical protein DSO57_1004046 [Entomophthora muscae]|uniref:Uncharacterized protein n=1 Tax=Entomophthora muscae TaxID=34485 RepID=A0ACC2U634_9FUNG|nr:hypothetical protein DSO57_1004046 [Entomophthora muscae]
MASDIDYSTSHEKFQNKRHLRNRSSLFSSSAMSTQFFGEFNGTINVPEKFLSLHGYCIPLYATPTIPKRLQKSCFFLLEQYTDILALNYHVVQRKIKIFPSAVPADEGIPVCLAEKVNIPPKLQIIVTIRIQLEIQSTQVIFIQRNENPSLQVPLACSRISGPVYNKEITVLLGNLAKTPMMVDTKTHIAYI